MKPKQPSKTERRLTRAALWLILGLALSAASGWLYVPTNIGP